MIDPSAFVSHLAQVGPGTNIWQNVQVREYATIGKNCTIGRDTYIGFGVTIGNNVKIQNGCQIYKGAVIEDGVFLGPCVLLINDRYPRAINDDGTLKGVADWKCGSILIKYGASVSSGSIVLPDVTIEEYAMVGAGSVVTKDVGPYGLVYGNPARLHGYVWKDGTPR